MITVLFVHGTGVRVDSYKTTLEFIEESLKFPEFPNLQVVGVPWGDQYGSRRASKSVFRYTETGAEEYTSEDAQSGMYGADAGR